MTDGGFEFIKETIPNQKPGTELMLRMCDVAQPSSVFSEPVIVGDYAVIAASEVTISLGYGYGGGGGGRPSAEAVEAAEKSKEESGRGYGAGGGGGGVASARPVAAIEVGPRGIHVEPIVDPTKIALAFFTALGAMFMMFNRMRQQARG